jgi:DNA-binding NarL/FixJ family response regulator
MRRHRILLVDNSPTLLRAVEALLTASAGIHVIGSARSGYEALERVREMEPDLVLMDLAMPGMDGLEATRRLAVLPRPPRVIIMTAHVDQEYRQAAAEVGADGFLVKADLGTHLLPLIGALLPGCGGDGDTTDSQA